MYVNIEILYVNICLPAAENQESSGGFGMAIGSMFAALGIGVVILISVGVYLKMKKRSGQGQSQDRDLDADESRAGSAFSIGDVFSSSSVASVMSVLPGEGHRRTVAFSSSSHG